MHARLSTEASATGLIDPAVQLPSTLIGDDEQVVLAVKPSAWLILFLAAPIATFSFVLAIMLTLIRGIDVSLSRWGIVICGLIILGRLIFAIFEWAGRCYVMTDSRVIVLQGVLNIAIFQCPLERIQNTYLLKPIIPRLLGLGHVVFATAGTGTPEAMWSFCRHTARLHQAVVQQIEFER